MSSRKADNLSIVTAFNNTKAHYKIENGKF